MPEGDTLHKAAAAIAPAIVGQPITLAIVARSTRSGPPPGTLVTDVRALGKNLIITFSDDSALRSHLKMTGSWRVVQGDASDRATWRGTTALVATEAATAICRDAPIAEFVDIKALARLPGLIDLGPDLCLADADIDMAVQRVGRWRRADDHLLDVLLDQRVAAGIGNVYKSEALWALCWHPLTRLRDVPEDAMFGLLAWSAGWLRANLQLPERTTIRGARPGTLAAYNRTGRPCPRCRTPLRSQQLGAPARLTTWCPTCQPPGRRGLSAPEWERSNPPDARHATTSADE